MMNRHYCAALVFCLAFVPGPGAVVATGVAAAGHSLTEWQDALQERRISSEALTRRYLARIRRLNPLLHAVIAVNPHAIEDARLSDARRAAGAPMGALDGIPVLLKDNIDVAGVATTAGSLALVHNLPSRDAGLVARLRGAGMVILGKTNLSEWANIRSNHSVSGWSAVGGIALNPYSTDRSACGSSSGSAVAVSVDLAPVGVGTETDGSITCPAAMNGLVGIKPTVGLVSRAGVVPISHSQDTPGPLARSVRDAASLLEAMSGSDVADAATGAADLHRTGYVRGLDPLALQGVRIGVLRFLKGYSPKTLAVFDAALRTLQAQGAILVDIDVFDFGDLGSQELTILLTEFKADVNVYLAGMPRSVQTRSLKSLIDFDRSEPRELALFGQELFERAAAAPGLDDAAYLTTLRAAREHAGPNGIDRLLRENSVVALIAPTNGPAWSIDRVNGDPGGGGSAGKLSAVSGYPHLTVPMGAVEGLPVGLSFMGPAWSERLLLSLGYAFERVAPVLKQPPIH